MTADERKTAERLVDALDLATYSDADARAEQFGLISKMLLTYPIANASAQTGAARGEAYLEALDDVPVTVLADAIKQWNRGEAGEHDYRWAPAPAVLRQVCLQIMQPLRDAISDLKNLLSALPLERALDPRPVEQKGRNQLLRSMS